MTRATEPSRLPIAYPPAHDTWRLLALFGSAVAVTLILGLVLAFGLGYLGLLLLLVLASVYAWMLFAFLHYRQCRQEEFLQVLTAAAEAEAPLAPAVWAYLRDRPKGTLREFSVALLLYFVVPGYYWFWYRRSNFDTKVERVAELLEAGHALDDALQLVPGVASRETLLAATLGEETGRLALCLQALRSPARGRLANLWLEMVPRLAYPLLLLLVISGVLGFWTLYIAPKFQRIFHEFDAPLPHETERAIALGSFALSWSWALALAVPGLALLVLLLLVNPLFRWYFPVVGGLYRAYVRSRILQALALLLQAGEPAPQALALLAEAGYFVKPARRRLDAVRLRVERGEPLADSLRAGRLLPRSLLPVLRSAERAGNLPWALGELADLLAHRAAHRAQRAGLALSPFPVLGVGVLVGLIVLGLFVPLIHLLEGLAQ